MADNTIRLTLKVDDQGTATLSKVSGSLKHMGDTGETAFKKINRSLSVIKWDAIVNLGERAFRAGQRLVGFTKEAADMVDTVATVSGALGITTEAFQKLSYAAKMSDVEQGTLEMGLRYFIKTIGDYSRGVGEAKDYIEALGLQIEDTPGKTRPFLDIFYDFVKIFSAMEEGTDKVNYALALLGSRAGIAMTPLMNQGIDRIEAYGRALQELGGIYSVDVLEAASRADDAFKNLGIQFDVLKIKSIPLGNVLLDLASKGVEAANTVTSFLERGGGIERIIGIIGETTKYGLLEGPSRILLEDISNRIFQGTRKKAEKMQKDIFDAYKILEGDLFKLELKIPAPKIIKGKDVLDAYKIIEGELFNITDELGNAFTSLGIKSERAWMDSANAAIRNVEIIKKAMRDGKAETLDYANALAAANKLLEKQFGQQKDLSQEKLDLEIEYQKRVRDISPEDPDRQRKVQEAIDDWSRAWQQLEAQAAKPVPITADISAAEAALDKLKTLYEQKKNEIESNPIKANVEVTMEHSPRMPFTRGMQQMMDQFGSFQDLVRNLEATIKFQEFIGEFGKLNKELAWIQDILPSIGRALMFSLSTNRSISAEYGRKVQEAEADKQREIYLLQLSLMSEILKIYGGSMQTGGHVQKTGLYTLHQGERVIPNRTVSTGDIHIHMAAGSGGSAKDLVRVLKYHLDRELRGLLA